MIFGVLPLFVITNLGAPRSILAGIEGSAELISYASRLVSGSLSDKLERGKFLFLLGMLYLQSVNLFFRYLLDGSMLLLLEPLIELAKG